VELGNLFGELPDWAERYRKLLEKAGDLLTDRLFSLSGLLCLFCAEKKPDHCHRKIITDYLLKKGYPTEHIP
jgi:hypothetical protein